MENVQATMTRNALREQFGSLIERHRGIVLKVAHMYCRHPEDRRDLGQEIAVQAWRSFAAWDAARPFSTWLYRIALNVAISFARSTRHPARQALALDELDAEPAHDDDRPRETDDGIRALYRCIDALDLCGMLRVTNRRAETLGLLDRKRLELARALATDPVILLLDEIGGGLTDAEAGELVATILELRRRNLAVVWIEHIVHILLQVVDRLVCMNAGRIIADGAPRAVMADSAVIDAYIGGSVA